MRALLLKYWYRIGTSFWFIPSVMAAAAIGLAQLMVFLDRNAKDEWVDQMSWIYSGGASGASAVLETIAGSMINIAGVVFSLTLVALSLTSSQFGPRLLRNFMRDRSNQLVLGTFVATFLYCLVVLRTVRHEDYGSFVPHMSVTVGVAFALASLWVLIYFIHHVSVSIQADHVVARVSAELQQTMETVFPEELGQPPQAAEPARDRAWEAEAMAAFEACQPGHVLEVKAKRDGYLQMIDPHTLWRVACEGNLVLRLERRPGEFVIAGTSLVLVWPAPQLGGEREAKLRTACVLGSQRTLAQDLEFAFLQLVEVAVRALSPGTNDPFTAIACIDHLAAALVRLARRKEPDARRYDEHGKLRTQAPPASFAAILDIAFDQIRQYGSGSAKVALALAKALATVAPACTREGDLKALQRHAHKLVAEAGSVLVHQHDRDELAAQCREVERLLARACRGAGGPERPAP